MPAVRVGGRGFWFRLLMAVLATAVSLIDALSREMLPADALLLRRDHVQEGAVWVFSVLRKIGAAVVVVFFEGVLPRLACHHHYHLQPDSDLPVGEVF